MNPETHCPIDPDDIRVGDRVQRRFEHDGGDIGTHEGTVKDVGSTYIRLQTLAFPKRIENATWTLLDRPAPPMEPLPTEPGTVIWVDAIKGEELDKPVKAMLGSDGIFTFARVQKIGWVCQPDSITAWHTAEPEFRTVSTAEELDALPNGAVIRDGWGNPAFKGIMYWITMYGRRETSKWIAERWTAPFTVLWEAGE